MATDLQAAPAVRRPLTIKQPNGETITIVRQGDEWCHWVTNMEGQLLVADAEGNYHVADAAEEAAWQVEKSRQLQRRANINAQRYEGLLASRARAAQQDGVVDNHALPSFPSKGQIRGLVLLVEYDDVHFTISNVEQHYQDMIKKEGYSRYNHVGSAHDYYIQNSMGQFDPQFDIYGPVTLPYPRKHYGTNSPSNDCHAYEMVIDACNLLDPEVDFSLYDNDKDGVLDFVFLFYAGEGEHADGPEESVWPHAWSINDAVSDKLYFDGVSLDKYACTNENIYGLPDGVGTFCHEFTHVLGLPDVYDVNYSKSSFDPGDFDLLAHGSYNGITSGCCPANLSSYERYELGWLEPKLLEPESNDTLVNLSDSNQAYILPVKSETEDPRDGEYYLFENRQNEGWDEKLPGHGMLVWHIDYQPNKWVNNQVNITSYHQCIDLVEADGKQTDASRKGDPFPGNSKVRTFSADTNPALLGWNNPTSRTMNKPINGAALTDISEEDCPELSDKKVITFYYDEVDEQGSTPADEHYHVIIDEGFNDATDGSDQKSADSVLDYAGNDNFSTQNCFQAGGAIRMGKSSEAGSITSRPLGNAAGDTLSVKVLVKGWTYIEGTLQVSAPGVETKSLTYKSTIGDDYEEVSCMLVGCEANTQVTIATSNRRCFITQVRIASAQEPSAIDNINCDKTMLPNAKIWHNGQLQIGTSRGWYNLQGMKCQK